MRVCPCPCLPFSPPPPHAWPFTRGAKPRERDLLKTLRLVSGTAACAVEQHGDTVDDGDGDDDDKGVRVSHPLASTHTSGPSSRTNSPCVVTINRVDSAPVFLLAHLLSIEHDHLKPDDQEKCPKHLRVWILKSSI